MRKKQIILVRHAKAVEREEWTGDDYDRPLSPEGVSANRIVANYIRLIGVKPDRLVASPAVRTKDTAIDIADKFKIKTVEYVPSLYNEGTIGNRDPMNILLDVVHSSKKSNSTLMIIGHNPDLTQFASYLSGEPVPSMKKGSMVVLSVPEGVEWKNITPGDLKFVYYLTPHFLRLEELI